MSKIADVFKALRDQGKAALIAYVMGGDPKPDCTPKIAEALIKGGADILELGIPFSDPIADGPTIQAASLRSLNAGTTPKMVLEMAHEIKKKHDTPIVVMTYFNPIFKFGLENFFELAKACEVNGVIAPDLPVEEADEYQKTAESFGIDTIFLAAPSTSNERLANIIDCSSGFLYLVSHFGVTGSKTALEKSTIELVKRVSCSTKGRIPLAVGFGVSKPEHINALIKAGVDGVIIGSVFVNIIEQNLKDQETMLSKITTTTEQLKRATL